MIVLSIRNLATKKVKDECFISKDLAEKRLHQVECDSANIQGKKKGFYLEGYSYDTESEKALIESFLPVQRRVTLEGVSNGKV